MTINLTPYLTHWQLTPTSEPLETYCSIIQHATQGTTPLTLKILKPNSDEQSQANVLNYYNGHGAVMIIDWVEEALLLEHLTIDRNLKDLPEEEATSIYCNVLNKLHTTTTPPQEIRPIETLATAFQTYLDSSDTTLDRTLVKQAYSVYNELCNTQQTPILLHGDLHHGNILHDTNRGWLAIDPKSLIGEREFDTACYLRNPLENPPNTSQLEQRIKTIAQNTNLNPERIKQWYHCQQTLAQIWTWEEKK